MSTVAKLPITRATACARDDALPPALLLPLSSTDGEACAAGAEDTSDDPVGGAVKALRVMAETAPDSAPKLDARHAPPPPPPRDGAGCGCGEGALWIWGCAGRGDGDAALLEDDDAAGGTTPRAGDAAEDGAARGAAGGGATPTVGGASTALNAARIEDTGGLGNGLWRAR